MSKIYTVLLKDHKEGGLVMQQLKAKSWNDAVLIMRCSGIVPENDIVSHTERPTFQFIKAILFPRYSETAKGMKVNRWQAIKCWASRSHQLVKWHDHGTFCKKCKLTFPND